MRILTKSQLESNDAVMALLAIKGGGVLLDRRENEALREVEAIINRLDVDLLITLTKILR